MGWKDTIVPAQKTGSWKDTIKPVDTTANISKTESFLRGAGQGVTYGFGDELQGRAEKLAAPTVELVGRGIKSLADLVGSAKGSEIGSKMVQTGGMVADQPVNQLVEEARIPNKEAFEANKKSYIAGNIVGAIPTTAVALEALPELGATGILSQGAILGGVSGLGSSEAENAMGKVIDTGVGSLVGVIGGVLAKGIEKAAPLIKDASVSVGRRAIGMIKSAVNKAGGPDKANKAVQVLLENGAIKGNLGQVVENVNALRESSGKIISDTLKTLDDAGIEKVFTPENLQNALLNKQLPEVNMTLGEFVKLPGNESYANALEKVLERAAIPRFAQGTFDAAQTFKQTLGQNVKWGARSDTADVWRTAYFIVRDTIDDAVEKLAPKIADKNLAKNFFAAKDAYSAAKTAEIGLDSAMRSATGNRILSLTDWIATAGRDPVTGMAVAIAKKAAESTRAMGAASRGLNVLGGLAEKVQPLAQPVGQAAGYAMPGVAGAVGTARNR